MDNTAVMIKPAISTRLLIAITLFLVFLFSYAFIYMLGVGMMMWDPSKIWERHPVVLYYIQYFWPAVMLFWTVASPLLVMIGKNWKWWVTSIVIGILSSFAVFCGWFALVEFVDK